MRSLYGFSANGQNATPPRSQHDRVAVSQPRALALTSRGGQAACEQRVRLVSVLEGGKVQQAAVLLVAQMPKARPPAVSELLDHPGVVVTKD